MLPFLLYTVMKIIYTSVLSVCFTLFKAIVNICHVNDGVLGRCWIPCAFAIVDSIVIIEFTDPSTCMWLVPPPLLF